VRPRRAVSEEVHGEVGEDRDGGPAGRAAPRRPGAGGAPGGGAAAGVSLILPSPPWGRGVGGEGVGPSPGYDSPLTPGPSLPRRRGEKERQPRPMRFDVLTLFPEIFPGYLSQSLLADALETKLVEVHLHNIRDWGQGRHKMVDDRPFGG